MYRRREESTEPAKNDALSKQISTGFTPPSLAKQSIEKTHLTRNKTATLTILHLAT